MRLRLGYLAWWRPEESDDEPVPRWGIIGLTVACGLFLAVEMFSSGPIRGFLLVLALLCGGRASDLQIARRLTRHTAASDEQFNYAYRKGAEDMAELLGDRRTGLDRRRADRKLSSVPDETAN